VLASGVVLTIVFGSACSSTRGGPCLAPKTPRTDVVKGNYAATYVSLTAPLYDAIRQANGGFIYSSPSKAVRARAIAAIDTFAIRATRANWPASVREQIKTMIHGLRATQATLRIKNKRDRRSVAGYRSKLIHSGSVANDANRRVKAELGLPLPVPC